MGLFPLNRLQKRLLFVQLVLLLFSLPGLYAYTELEPRDDTETSGHRPAPLEPYEAALKVEPPSQLHPLPTNRFRLKPLSPDEKRRVQLRLRVDVNRADTGRLRTLRGVGPVTARKIRRYRLRSGPFRTIRDLKNIDGIGPVTLRGMASQIRLGDRLPEPLAPLPEHSGDTPLRRGQTLDVNAAGVRRLRRLPGVGPVIAGRITQYRESEGPFRGPEQLKNVKGIGPKTVADLRPFLRFSPSGTGEGTTNTASGEPPQ